MPEYQYLTAHYNGETGNIDMWVRDTTSLIKKKIFISGFVPYFYVPSTETIPVYPWIADTKTGFVHMDGKPDTMIIATDPNSVGQNREKFVAPHEADVNYVQRLLIDTGILSCFYTPINSVVVPYKTIVPVNKVIQPHYVFVDIEVFTRGRFPNIRNPTQPVIAVTFYDSQTKKYYTICIDDRVYQSTHKKLEPDWDLVQVLTPKELYDLLKQYLIQVNPDIISGWNIKFDIDYLQAWAKLKFKETLDLSSCEVFDLLTAYKKIKSSLGNKLKEVVVKEDLIKAEDMVSDTFKIEMYTDKFQRDDFIKYNKKDIEYCVLLNDGFKRIKDGVFIQYKFLQNFWSQKNFVGLANLEFTTLHVKRHDPLWLRTAHQLGFTLPTSYSDEEAEDLEYGGVVFTPPAGIYRNITVLDMSRYYPSILLSFPKETSPDIWGKLAPAVITYLSKERDFWDAEVKKFTPGTEEYKTAKLTQTNVKTFLSGAWGYFAYKGSRIYSKERGDFVLQTAGEGLNRVKDRAKKVGHDTIYGDTDSIFLGSTMEEVEGLVAEVNDELTLWAKERGIVDSKFHIKEDRFALTTLFIKAKNSEEGAKKRYGQRIVRENNDPCDYILIKGFDYVRGNTSEVTRKLQKEVIDQILMDDTSKIIGNIQKIMKDITTKEYDLDQITIPINLGKPFEHGEEVGGEYYDGAIWNNRYIGESIVSGDMVRYFRTKDCGSLPYNQWVSYLDADRVKEKGIIPDYDWVVSRTLRSPLENILGAAGISWDNICGLENVDESFGD